MSYDNPNRVKYQIAFNFAGASDDTFVIKGPKGKDGRLHNFGVEGTTQVFNGSTITPKVSIGTAATPLAYTTALVLHGLADATATSIRSLYNEQDAAFATAMHTRNLPADTSVVMHLTVATGSPTGAGTAFFTVDWMD